MTEKTMQIRPYPLGAHCEAEGIRFAFASKKKSCGIILYDKNTGKKIQKIFFAPDERIGNVYCKYVSGIDAASVSYHFFEEDQFIPDEHARAFEKKLAYGKAREEKELRAVFVEKGFDWEADKKPQIPYEQCLAYCMHVRGFTKHSSSNVTHRGTFLGVIEKIPYLKETGVTTIELQPAYEFLELPTKSELQKEAAYMMPIEEADKAENRKLNYWGYKKGFYYTPKAAYAAGEDVPAEFKTLVKELHKNNMELVMQFYFPKEIFMGEIAEILRFWVLEYHVDGFHLMGENLSISMLAKDPVLADSKLWYYHFNTEEYYDKSEIPQYCNLAEYQDDYLYTMRRFLKGDENMLSSVLYQMRHIPEKAGRIHYMSNYYGLTLKDMVSYDHKHNDANGEGNHDGNDYNCSWNCGEEGNTRKRKIVELRKRQLKNAFCMLLLTQSTPLIFMGDEFGNSQQGNNNPYCQDNNVTWLDWRDLERNKELYQFWVDLVNMRKEHPVLRPERELRIMDYISCGYPDLSYHGQNAWRPQLECYFRHVGIMLCGKYAKKDKTQEDDFFYIAMNMHWEPHELAFPKLPKGMKWQSVGCTDRESIKQSTISHKVPVDNKPVTEEKSIMEAGEEQLFCIIPPRSIEIFKSVIDTEKSDATQKSVSKNMKNIKNKKQNIKKKEE